MLLAVASCAGPARTRQPPADGTSTFAAPERAQPAATISAPAASGARADLDVPVTDQDGRSLRFGRDVLDGKILVVNFVYTHCTAVCPIQATRFRGLQTLLGERLGREVRLVSISLDPENDTPAALKEWGCSFGARPGWVLLTGEPQNVRALVEALLGAPLDREMHSPFLLVGDGRAPWKRVYGLAAPSQFLKTIADVESASPGSPVKEALR